MADKNKPTTPETAPKLDDGGELNPPVQPAMDVTVSLNEPEAVAAAAAQSGEPKLEDLPEFKDLVENNTLLQLKEILLAHEFIGVDFIENKKAAAATIVTMRRRLKVRETGSIVPNSQPLASTIPTVQDARVVNNHAAKAKAMKEYCAKAPKIKTMIPFDLGEKMGSYAELQINGYKLNVLKGVYVDLPQPFADLVSDSWQQTAAAGNELLLDRIDPETGKPVSESQALL